MFLYGILFSVLGALGMGAYGYYEGYEICTQSQQVKLLKAEVKRLQLSNYYIKSAVEAAKQIESENQNTITQNNETITSLKTEIENERANKGKPSGKCVIDADFLQRVDSIK